MDKRHRRLSKTFVSYSYTKHQNKTVWWSCQRQSQMLKLLNLLFLAITLFCSRIIYEHITCFWPSVAAVIGVFPGIKFGFLFFLFKISFCSSLSFESFVALSVRRSQSSLNKKENDISCTLSWLRFKCKWHLFFCMRLSTLICICERHVEPAETGPHEWWPSFAVLLGL